MKAVKEAGVKALGWTLLVIGIAAIPLPGPGALIILGAMFVLATQYEWAEQRLERVKLWALRGAADGVKTWPRVLLSLLGVAWMIGIGVVWGLQPSPPEFWPLPRRFWLVGGWYTGGTLIGSGVIALVLVVYSFVKLRGRDFGHHKRKLRREHEQVRRESADQS